MNNKMSFGKVIFRTLQYGMRKTPLYFTVFVLVALLASLTNMFSIVVVQQLIDSIQNGTDHVIKMIAFTGGILILYGIANVFYEFVNRSYFLRFICIIIEEMNDKASRLQLIEFESVKLFEKISMAINGVASAINSTLDVLRGLIYYLIFFTSISIYLFCMQPKLTAIILLIFIPKVLSQLVKGSRMKKLQEETVLYEREKNYYMDCLTDKEFYKETRVLRLQNFFLRKYENSVNKYTNKYWETCKKLNLIDLCLDIFTYAAYITSLGLIIYSIFTNKIELGIFVAIYYSLQKLMDMTYELVQLLGEVYKNYGLAGNLYQFLDMEEMVEKKEKLEEQIDEIRLENVSFTYPYCEKSALKNISVSLKRNSKIAIVGINGSGKSTLSKILLGLLAPDQGRVIYNSTPIENVNQKSVFKCGTALFQNFGKYKLSALENICISDVEKQQNDKYIEEVLKKSNVDIKKICGSLDQILSKEFDGIDLSGGQWQSLAIARTIYRNHDIIILDEPTSAIDPIEEKKIYDIFNQISKGKIAIIITHRLGFVKNADRILVMEKGRIVENGSHKELVARNGLYAKMLLEQMSWYNH